MEFLDNLVLPQSSEHMVLLRYLLILTFVLMIPYLSALVGMLGYSLFYGSWGKKKSNPVYIRFAKDVVSIITPNKSIAFALGIIPFLSAIFCYAQLLHLSGTNVIGYLSVSFMILVLSLILIYSYRHSFHMSDIFGAFEKSESIDDYTKNEIKEYQNKTSMLAGKSGIWGFVLLMVSTYIFIAGIQYAADSSMWGDSSSVLSVLFSLNSITYFLFFIAISFAVSSAVILYYYFRPTAEEVYFTGELRDHVKKVSLRNGLIFTAALPVFIVLNLLSKPGVGLTTGLFAALLISLFLILIISNMFYTMLKEFEVKYSSSILFMFIVLFFFIITKDQIAFSSATQLQAQKLSQNYVEYKQNLKEEMGLIVEEISGEDIYNGRCIACHQYEQRLVGPPYKEVLPKYEGKFDELVGFILNPVKVNPEYPAMPNQGLKPKEAEAVAEYLIQTYQQ